MKFRHLLLSLVSVFAISAAAVPGHAFYNSGPADPLPATGCGDGWDTTFTTNGANGTVEVVVSDGAGNIYIGGSFTAVNGVPAGGIAKWDGTAWSGLGSGIPMFGVVKAIAVSGSDVYIGGSFHMAGEVLAKNVAKWDGSSWSALGAGLGGGTHMVHAAAVLGGDVYFGGNFNTNDGSPANGIVRWDGSAYSAVGTGNIGQVSAITAAGGSLYVGGFVSPTVGVSVGIMKWDGTSWSAMGTSDNTTVISIASSGTDVYALGNIRLPGQPSASVAKWDGTAWTRLGGVFGDAILSTIAVVGGDVYVGGRLPSPNNFFNNIARWNGTSWVGVAGGVTGDSSRVYGIAASGDTLFVGGTFTAAGTGAQAVGARNLAKLTAGTWSAFVGTGLDAAASAIAVSGTDVYVGGRFITAGPITVNRIAKWNGVTNTWSALGTGVTVSSTSSNNISAIAVVGGNVYAGGNFSAIGGVAARNIAVWNGTNWAPLGAGVDAAVTVITAHGDSIYVGGDFQNAGGAAANRIAKWNGTGWSALAGSPVPTTVTAIAFAGSDMYVGTTTSTAENPNYLLKYDGTTWTPLGAGFGGHGISSIATLGSDIYVTGGFSSIGGVTVNRIAKWNGSSWSALGGGLPSFSSSSIAEAATAGTDIIAIGDFTVAGGGPGDRIAKWNGTSWSPMGAGMDQYPTVATSAGGDVFVGGNFSTAGCNNSPYFARWRNTLWTGTSGTDWHTAANWGSGGVPPANSGVSIFSADATISSADVTLSSLIVSSGRTVTVGAGRTLTVTGDVDLSSGNVAGTGALVVSGDLTLSNGNITGLGSVVVHGNLYLDGGKISGTGPVAVTSCRPGAIVRGSDASFISAVLSRCVDGSGIYKFPVGTDPVYAPVEIANVSGSSTFTVEAKAGPYSGTAAGLPAVRLQRWWQLTGGITQADVSFNYKDSDVVGTELAHRVFRINGGTAARLTSSVDTGANRATAPGVTAFGAFTMAEGESAIASVMGGRVTTPSGRSAEGVAVTLTEANGNTRTARTNQFGYYRFLNVETFRIHTVVLQSKKYRFAMPEQSVLIDGDDLNVNFVSSNR